jgi:WhiB family redox-sensing transcriptional regulator
VTGDVEQLFPAAPWMGDALCREPAYQDLPWFPAAGETFEAAKAVCGGCAVREECLAYASTVGATTGMWGGHTPKERKLTDRRLGLAGAAEGEGTR